MFKLLVNTPAGTQEVVSVSQTGGYFDLARVLWDERIDGPLPAITLGAMVRTANGLVFDQPTYDASASNALFAARDFAITRIDADADAIRNTVLGGRTTEYQQAESDAESFKAAGYTGTIPDSVQNWLDAKSAVGAGWTAQQAADDILATAANWKSAQSQIRANRLLRKEQVKAATVQADIDTAMSAWRTFRDGIRAQLGLAPA